MNFDWKEVKLGEVCDTISVKHKFNKDKIVLINTSDVLEGKVLNHKYDKNKNLKGQFKKSFQKDDILYSEIRPQNKRFAYIDFDSTDYVASTKLMVLRNKNNILSKYLFQILKADNTINELQSLAETRSGTFPQITYSELSNLSISLPPLPEQKAIADTLSCLDDKIELNNKINKNLEELAQAIFKSWFVDFEPFADGEFEDSELGRIPKGWRVGTIGECCQEVVRGFTSKYVDYSNIKNLNQKVNKGNYLEKQYYKYLREDIKIPNNKFAQRYDILLNSLGQGTLGRVHLFIDFEKNIVIDQHITIIRTGNLSVSSIYLYLLLSSPSFQNLIEGLVTGSTGMQMLNISKVRTIKIIIPSKDLICNFDGILKHVFEKIAFNNKENETLTTLRDTLLPKLMSGEIRVPIDKN